MAKKNRQINVVLMGLPAADAAAAASLQVGTLDGAGHRHRANDAPSTWFNILAAPMLTLLLATKQTVLMQRLLQNMKHQRTRGPWLEKPPYLPLSGSTTITRSMRQAKVCIVSSGWAAQVGLLLTSSLKESISACASPPLSGHDWCSSSFPLPPATSNNLPLSAKASATKTLNKSPSLPFRPSCSPFSDRWVDSTQQLLSNQFRLPAHRSVDQARGKKTARRQDARKNA
jgi:hypothetical protein